MHDHFKLDLKRLCTDILHALNENRRFSVTFLDTIQSYVERHTVRQFEMVAQLSSHRAVQLKDVQVMAAIQAPHIKTIATRVPPVKSMGCEMRRLSRVAGVHAVSPAAITHMQTQLQAHLTAVLNATTMAAMLNTPKAAARVLTVKHLREGLGMLDICLV